MWELASYRSSLAPAYYTQFLPIMFLCSAPKSNRLAMPKTTAIMPQLSLYTILLFLMTVATLV